MSQRFRRAVVPAGVALAVVTALAAPASAAPGADRDRDGMPDSYEVAHGLNPRSAADAGLDSTRTP